jgi:deazaflavin-dependent oxidoreductase (nitroreductase family)
MVSPCSGVRCGQIGGRSSVSVAHRVHGIELEDEMPLREDYPDPREFNLATAKELRETGDVTGDFAGREILILTTTGAKTGNRHETPLGYTNLSGRIMVSAGAGGADKNPAWYHNLVANPEVTVEIPGRTFQATATPLVGEEYALIAADRLKTNAGFARNQSRTKRVIPLIWLDPID